MDFHVRTGATAISWPHHKAESHNLTIAERKALAEVAIKTVAKRVPISIHVSTLALEDTYDLARHAQKSDADAIIAITPYFWKYPPEAIYDYFVDLGTSIDLPLITYNSPSYLDGIEFTGELTARLIERLPNLDRHEGSKLQQREILRDPARRFAAAAGLRDDRRAWNISCRRCRSAAPVPILRPARSVPIYASSYTSAAPAGKWARARELQYKLSQLWLIFRDQYPSSLKGGCVIMGRPVGPTAPPLPTASPERIKFIEQQLDALGILQSEPHGW